MGFKKDKLLPGVGILTNAYTEDKINAKRKVSLDNTRLYILFSHRMLTM